jgi:hypothetical protein
MNGTKESSSMTYFDKRSNEEDMPIMPQNKIIDKYEKLEDIYENLFDTNNLSLAKVC